MNSNENQFGINTCAVYGGERVGVSTHALKTPIYASNTFSYPSKQIISLAMRLDDIHSIIEWPYIMTHYDLEYELKVATGVTELLF